MQSKEAKPDYYTQIKSPTQGTILKMHGKPITTYSEKRVNNELLIDYKT